MRITSMILAQTALAFGCQQVPQASVPNLHEVTPGLYRSGRPSLTQVAELAKDPGIKTIVSLETYFVDPDTGKSEEQAAAEVGIKFIHIPIAPVGELDTNKVERAYLAVITEARPLLFHCYRGSERTGIIAALYRMRVDGWTKERAEIEADTYGFNNTLFRKWKEYLK